MERIGGPRLDPPGREYEIRIQGRLDTGWTEWFDGMSLTHAADGTTVLVGQIADQAALHGLLARLRDLGVTLLAVNGREPGEQAVPSHVRL